MSERVISVPEIHCDHCKMSIEGAVGAVEGVRDVRVDVEERTVSVRFDGPAEDAIVEAIEGQGYEVPR